MIGEVELALRFLKGQGAGDYRLQRQDHHDDAGGGDPCEEPEETLVGGNIGTPVIALVGQSTPDTMVVLEVSSFQLERIEQFCPWIAVILNITPDHLDRHHISRPTRREGANFENQQSGDFAVLNADETVRGGERTKSKARCSGSAASSASRTGAFVHGDQIIFRQNGQEQAGA